ncbi:pyrroline-5-carboxylate reductase [uncultured Cetobacterium sp.]|uniref:pyrroline-5-carboxylate reductase n=3 Tax=uncultured Cetobacterium sp. TaxID=527638 RepID=UPI00262285CA|nr:pyrroline-5-carboxylate reductase [uncultured Cetobacterium sp.]
MKIGFIGCGNMAKALINGMVSSETVSPQDVIASDAYFPALEKTHKELNINITSDNKEVVKSSKYIVLAVKPQFYTSVISEIKEFLTEESVIITLAPGKTIADLENLFTLNTKIIRTMPNTPAMVGAGVTAICKNSNVTEEELKFTCSLFESCGLVEVITENLINAVISVSGSSPAYVFMMIEAMADGAVMNGLPRDKAYKFAAQALLGSAKMLLETNMHPGALKDMVCSPGGTTIQAVRTLEKTGFRSSIIEAMDACVEKAKQM